MPDYASPTVADAMLTGSSYGKATALDEPGASTPPLASAATNVRDAMAAYRAGQAGTAYSLTNAAVSIASQIAGDADAAALVSSCRSFTAALAQNGYTSSPDLDVMAAELAQTAASIYQLATSSPEPGEDLAALAADQQDAIARQESADELAATRGAVIDAALTNPVASGLAGLGQKIIDTAKKAPGAIDSLTSGLGSLASFLPVLLLALAAFVLWRLFGR
jgi:hypothetical protein